ncbi:major facilitator superfamily domain-containing protein 8-like isoform X2 [Rhopilema esculentum]
MHLRSCREPLIGSIFAGILSGLLYAIAQGVGGDNGLWIVLVSRLFLGFTRGNLTITRAVVSESTTPEERSHAMINLVISMTGGFALGSGIQALISLLGERELYISALRLHFNLYTIPAYLLVCLGIINGLLIFHFVKTAPKKEESRRQTDKEEKPFKGKLLTCLTLIGMFAITNFCLSLMETLTTPFVQHQFSLTRAKAVWYGGIVFTCQGLIGICQQGVLRFLVLRFSDRLVVAVVYGCLMLSFLLYIPLGNTPLMVAEEFAGNITRNGTSGQQQFVGCPASFDWCRDTPQIWMPQYVFGAVFFAIGYSSCLGLLVSIYTKIVAAKRQGKVVSLISSSGNLGRLTAPILGSTSYVTIGPGYTYTWVFCALLAFFLAYLIQFKKMIPSPVKLDQDEFSINESESADDLVLFVTPV